MAAGTNIVDYATLTVGTATVTLVTDASPTLPGNAHRAYITCETAAVRWRADGTAPTATEGHSLAAADSLSFTGNDYRRLLEDVQWICSASTGYLKITYFD